MSSINLPIPYTHPDSPILSAVLVFGQALVLIVVLNVAHQKLVYARNKSLPPLVFHYFPVIGSAVSYGIDPYKFMFDCRAKYGDVFTFVLLGRKVTVALGSAGSNFIFNGKLKEVSAEEAYTHLTTPVFGTDVVYDCPNHLLMEQKKFVKFGLSTERFKAYVPMIFKETIDYFSQASKKPMDAFKGASELTICTASATLQGKEVREGMHAGFADLYKDLDGGFTPLNFIFPNLPLPSYRRRDVAHIKMEKFYLDIMAKRREEGREETDDVLSSLQGVSYRDGRQLTDKEISHIMIALLMAGQHTSAATSSWILLHLAARPDIQQALYEEQKKVFWNEETKSFNPLTYESLSELPIVASVIKEVLRLHPPLHSIMRKVISPMTVPPSLASPSGGNSFYVIPDGYYLLAAPGVACVDPEIWDNPNGFDPYRWIYPNKDSDKPSPISFAEDDGGEKVDFGWGKISTGANSPYLPFGAGRHRCIGEQFANVQLGTIVSTLVREYQWRLKDEKAGVPDQDYTTMIVCPKKPRDIIFTKRN